jgi:diphthamide synthase (EF-2-diphthine--ammonia ligase)
VADPDSVSLSERLAREMVSAGLRARLTCVNPQVLDRSFAGREFNEQFLAELPAAVDPCGERGEFHSFAYDGPMFTHPISITTGAVVERDGFVFCDLEMSPSPFRTSRTGATPARHE